MAPLSEMHQNTGDKRKPDVIDLTDSPPAKHAKVNNGPSSAYQTPPASSAARSSQSYTNRHAYGSQPSSSGNQHSQRERESWQADDDREASEIFSSTQAAAADTEQLQLYGHWKTKIVGVQYYRGYASPGEQILVKREPNNPYDRNAIRIYNVAGTQYANPILTCNCRALQLIVLQDRAHTAPGCSQARPILRPRLSSRRGRTGRRYWAVRLSTASLCVRS